MANNVPITAGTGTASVAGETVGGITYQQIEVYGAGGASVLSINPDGSFKASIVGTPTVTFSGTPSISGAVTVVGTVPMTQSGTVISSLVSTVPSSVLVGASIYGTAPVTQSGAWSTSVVGNVGLTGTPSISGAVTIVGNVALSPSIFGASIIGAPPANLFVGGAVVTSSNAVPIQPPASGFLNTQVSGSVLTLHAATASLISGVTSVISGTASVLVLAAAPGAQRNYISQLLVTNAAAVGTFVDIVDGGSVIYSGYAAASGGGFSASFNPPLKQPTQVQAIYTATRAQASVIVSASGYTAS